MKRQKRNGSGNPEGRTYQFPFGKLRAPCREPRQFLRFGESLRGAGGSAPSHAIWRARGLTRSKQSFPEKSPAGAFFPFHRPREAACLCHCVRLDGCEYSHPEPSAFGLSLSHPRRGSTPEAAGGSFTPSGVSRPIPGPGRGKVGAQAPRLLPRWATIGGVGGPAIA